MRHNFFFILLFLNVLSNIGFAQTNVSGFISTNTNWSLAGSPYIVVGNTLVMTGVTLTVDPGVVVKFDTSRAVQIDGTLIAIGTATNRITFTSNKTVPAAGDWGRIQFSDSCINASYDTNGNYLSGSIMKYCDVWYGGKISASGTAAVEMHYSSPYISNCTVISSGGTGILCAGSSVKIDSSSIKYCTGFGIYLGLYNAITGPCTLTIQNDTISFNTNGGIGFNNAGSPCLFAPIRILIDRNYFKGNTQNGALYVENNSLSRLVVSDNTFENNISSHNQGAGGAYLKTSNGPIIECNRFINNQGTTVSALYLRDGGYDTGFVRNNIFDDNICTFVSPFSSTIYFRTSNQNYEEYFTNNIIRNNITPGGTTCIFSGFPLTSPMTTFHIDSNEFINNQAMRTINLMGSISSFTDQFATLAYNNFINPNCQYEIYNDCPYGGPNINAYNNYWNSSNVQHVDSVIYDFFDNANQSVVFYLPILSSTVAIDTICPSVLTGLSSIEKTPSNLHIYPNPTSTYVVISFATIINKGVIEIYNMLGERVIQEVVYHTSEKEINLQSISNGIYLVKLFDGEKYYFKKIIVEHD
jgi:type IX secretion system substrate protein/parallel beta helix pectate lyase-like protein